jgi:hypothetical protein
MISFIVPAYNEEDGLAVTLDAVHAVARALPEPYELVVADDASTDRTAAIAREHGAIVVSVAHRQIAATRNSGARATRGEWLIFVDADTLVNEAVVRAALQAMRGGAVGGGAGMRFDDPAPLYARLLLRLIMRGFRATGLAAGCFMFCTRQAYVAAGGFDENYFGAEELVMSQRPQAPGPLRGAEADRHHLGPQAAHPLAPGSPGDDGGHDTPRHASLEAARGHGVLVRRAPQGPGPGCLITRGVDESLARRGAVHGPGLPAPSVPCARADRYACRSRMCAFTRGSSCQAGMASGSLRRDMITSTCGSRAARAAAG